MGFVFALPVTAGSLVGGYIYALHPTYPWILQLAFLLASIVLSVLRLHEPPTRRAVKARRLMKVTRIRDAIPCSSGCPDSNLMTVHRSR